MKPLTKIKRKLLLVNWGTQDKEYPFQAAREMGLEVYLATTRNYPTWIGKYVKQDNLIYTNPYDSEKLITDVFSYMYHRKVRFDGVTTFFEMSMIPTADLAALLSMPFLPPTSARKSSANKLVMRILSQKAKINTPSFYSFQLENDGLKLAAQLGFPCVIKPVRSGHSFGAIKVINKNGFHCAFQNAKSQRNHIFDEWMGYYDNYKDDWLIEEYLEGKVISVDGLVQNKKIFVIGTTEFFMGDEPYLTQEGECTPARIDQKTRNVSIALTHKLINLLEFDNCGFHCELRLTGKGPFFLEIAGRPPGGKILEEYYQSTGINFAREYINMALGEKIRIKKEKTVKHVFIKNIFPAKSGLLKKIVGLESLNIFPMLKVEIHMKEGNFLKTFLGISDPVISILGTVDKKTDITKIINNINKNIIIVIKSSAWIKIRMEFENIFHLIHKTINRLIRNPESA